AAAELLGQEPQLLLDRQVRPVLPGDRGRGLEREIVAAVHPQALLRELECRLSDEAQAAAGHVVVLRQLQGGARALEESVRRPPGWGDERTSPASGGRGRQGPCGTLGHSTRDGETDAAGGCGLGLTGHREAGGAPQGLERG